LVEINIPNNSRNLNNVDPGNFNDSDRRDDRHRRDREVGGSGGGGGCKGEARSKKIEVRRENNHP
jgi:hypothetical protein